MDGPGNAKLLKQGTHGSNVLRDVLTPFSFLLSKINFWYPIEDVFRDTPFSHPLNRIWAWASDQQCIAVNVNMWNHIISR